MSNGGLKRIGPRILGFQISGQSNGDIHDRSTTHAAHRGVELLKLKN
jgi:hypothetical protein